MVEEVVQGKDDEVTDDAFLRYITEAAKMRRPVSHADVQRLRQLADWADAFIPLHWDGYIDHYETLRAVHAARKRLTLQRLRGEVPH